jgi:hypothetical protein
MKPPLRYWRFGVAAVIGLAVGAVLPGSFGLVVGVVVALTAIVLLERRLHRPRR